MLNSDLNSLKEGKLILDSDKLFAIISKNGNSRLTEPKMESHQKYIDIHFVVNGIDTIGWKSLTNCDEKIGAFNFGDDYILYQEQDFPTFTLTQNKFMIFFPEDMHVPGLDSNDLFKIVLKVKL